MGLLVKGQWHTDWYNTEGNDGEFIRQDAQFRDWIEREGDKFPAESGRYHLYVSLACPWAHRTLIMRQVKQLGAHIGVTIVKPEMLENGWELKDNDGPEAGISFLYELYLRMDPNYSGRVTVPVLWDKHTHTIVNNESADILRILNTAFNALTPVQTDYYPQEKQDEIDKINAYVYDAVNNGVYKTGFATRQGVYERHYRALFMALDTLEQRLSEQRYLVGSHITEADWRLFTTLIRFDSVYHGHFKCNRCRIEDFHNLSNYLRDLYQQPGVAETVDFDHIKTHYYYSHDMINPTRIVPLGPEVDYSSDHDRERFG